MSLKVLIYCDDPDGGGTAVCTHQLALGLAGRGYRVVYAQTRVDEARIAEREAAGIAHRFIPYDTMKHYYLSISDRRGAADILRETDPDVAVFADSTVESLQVAKEVAAGLGIPFLSVKHMVLPDNPATADPPIRARIRRGCELAYRVVTVSEATKALLCRDFEVDPAHVAVIPNSRPALFFDPPDPADRAALRREWGIAPDAFVVMSIGSMIRLKGYDVALKAVRRLAAEGRLGGMVFVWIGDGGAEYIAGLKAAAESAGVAAHILFLGRRTDVARCLAAADAFLLCSQSESFSLVLAEAMGKGLPVVATAVGGVPETVGGCGVLVPSPLEGEDRTAIEIARVLAGWRDDPARAQTLGRAAAARAREAFGEERFLDRYGALIDAAVLAPGDYVSPGLRVVRPDRLFATLITLDERVRTAGTRRDLRHNRYADGTDLHRLLPGRDEVVLLHNLALAAIRETGSRAGLQIGVEMGWAASHLLMAGLTLDILDPRVAEPPVQAGLLKALGGLSPDLRLWVGAGPGAVDALARQGRRWSFQFFNLAAPEPEIGTLVPVCVQSSADDAMLVFWNLLSGLQAPILWWLRDRGWRITLYDTAQMIAVACRGRARPVAHRPDPDCGWLRPPDLDGLEAPLPAERY